MVYKLQLEGDSLLDGGRGYLNDDDFMEAFLLFNYEDDDKDDNNDDGNATWSARTSWPGRGNEEVWIGLCGTWGRHIGQLLYNVCIINTNYVFK